jgi:hypothetical protein
MAPVDAFAKEAPHSRSLVIPFPLFLRPSNVTIRPQPHATLQAGAILSKREAMETVAPKRDK